MRLGEQAELQLRRRQEGGPLLCGAGGTATHRALWARSAVYAFTGIGGPLADQAGP